MDESSEPRLDKWLWAVRLFKTRTQAADACKAGHVKIGGLTVKPARIPRPGEIITITADHLTRTVKVLASLHNRVGAAMAKQYMEDLTPPEEYARRREAASTGVAWTGKGRPTKKMRRLLHPFLRQD